MNKAILTSNHTSSLFTSTALSKLSSNKLTVVFLNTSLLEFPSDPLLHSAKSAQRLLTILKASSNGQLLLLLTEPSSQQEVRDFFKTLRFISLFFRILTSFIQLLITHHKNALVPVLLRPFTMLSSMILLHHQLLLVVKPASQSKENLPKEFSSTHLIVRLSNPALKLLLQHTKSLPPITLYLTSVSQQLSKQRNLSNSRRIRTNDLVCVCRTSNDSLVDSLNLSNEHNVRLRG